MDPAISSDMLPNTTCRFDWEYPGVTISVDSMSQFASPRTPYADAETPHQMMDDCRAVGSHLSMPVTRDTSRDDRALAHLPTTWFVSEQAAALASGLHLHLD